jgi:Mg-chelatase subunit ChlD
MQTYNINKLPMGYGSNLQNGIETACSLFKNGTGKRIVLLTDGCENIGSVTSSLTDKDIELKVKGFKDEEIAEVQLSSLKVPEYITDGNVKAEISITSTVAETAVLELYVNDRQIYNAEVDIGIGDNRFAVNSNIEETGNLNFKAVVQPTADTYHQNNVIYAHSYTNSAPKILLLEYDGSGAQLEALLKSGDMDVTKTDIRNAPKDIDSLNVYDEILLADCSYYDMSEDFIKSLESYVRSSAGGLLVTGGENAFAPGGYNDTELEKILPVNMEMSDTDKKKKTAMLMVVDRSGSMSVGNYGVSKLELVKEAMVRSVESLDTGDSVGILAFDDANEWIVKPTEIKSDTDNIERKIYGINDGGGTSIQPALEEAVNTLSAYEADSKHIILMTDGQGEDSGYEDVINNALKNNITISTIAVGNDADTELLENIASVAQGRYYYTDEFTDLPRIFERETLLSDKKYVNNESFYPIANETDDIMQGIDMIPELDGYIATDKKTASNVVLSHNNNEPILAIWQYGLGHTAVFTSDVQNQCSSWLSSEEGCTIIKNTVSSLLRSRNLGNIETEVKEKDGNKILSVTVKNNNTDEINGTITGNDTEQVLNFTQVKTGTFEADINAQESGNYVVNIESKGTYDSEFFSGIISIAYPDEYKIQNLNSGDTLLAKLSTIGADADAPKDVFTEYTKEVYDKLSVKQSLLWLALALLYVDVLLRRFGRIKKTSVNETKAKGDKNAVPKPDAEVKKPENKPTEVSTSSLLLKNKRNRQK